jgi:hypothetical protein
MKIKVYGFKFNQRKLPTAMKATDAFAAMQSATGVKLGEIYRVGAHPVVLQGGQSQWWGGMVLKVRDSSAFTKMTKKAGKTILTAETLAENEQLVELTYFVAHPETGSGLLAHHYHGTSLTSFGNVCRRVFAAAQRKARLAALGTTPSAEHKALRKTYAGELFLEQLCNDTNLKDLIKELKRVSSFELRLATLETKETFLKGVIEKASNEVIKLTFPPEADVEGLADDAVNLADAEEVAEIKVSGYDAKKNYREYFRDQNPLVFHEFDYDDIMKGLVLDLDDWAASISGSSAIKKLLSIAHGKSTLNLLKKA